MKGLIVVNRGEDFMAHLEGNTKIWGAEKTIAAAVLDVLLHHPEAFGVNIQLPEDHRK